MLDALAATLKEKDCAGHAEYIPGNYVTLAVHDNGCGMDAETLRHIFEPFFTTKERGRGTGLGLPMVYGIVKQNNGFIDISSEPGKGTTFRIFLPRREGVLVVRDVEAVISSPVATEGGALLLVEDDPAMLLMTRVMIERLGYNVLSANSPGEALRIAQERGNEIRLLVTDVIMPGMNGRELANTIGSLYPAIKCLFMSGYTGNAGS